MPDTAEEKRTSLEVKLAVVGADGGRVGRVGGGGGGGGGLETLPQRRREPSGGGWAAGSGGATAAEWAWATAPGLAWAWGRARAGRWGGAMSDFNQGRGWSAGSKVVLKISYVNDGDQCPDDQSVVTGGRNSSKQPL